MASVYPVSTDTRHHQSPAINRHLSSSVTRCQPSPAVIRHPLLTDTRHQPSLVYPQTPTVRQHPPSSVTCRQPSPDTHPSPGVNRHPPSSVTSHPPSPITRRRPSPTVALFAASRSTVTLTVRPSVTAADLFTIFTRQARYVPTFSAPPGDRRNPTDVTSRQQRRVARLHRQPLSLRNDPLL